MKTQEEIEQLAENSSYNNSEHFEDYQDGMFYGYIKGYTQCQEDIKPFLEDLFSLWQSLAKCGEISVGIDFTKHYERLKQQLNKQD
jgi:hypothetical protein